MFFMVSKEFTMALIYTLITINTLITTNNHQSSNNKQYKNMKKEEIYVNLQGKTKEELTDLWEFLESNGEKQTDSLGEFLNDYDNWGYLSFDTGEWTLSKDTRRTEVTIEQLKEIIKPMGTLQQQLQKAEAEVKRLQSLIEEENKPKVGDLGYFYDDGKEESKLIGKLTAITTLYYAGDINFDNFKKITNLELIKLLEQEIK